MKVTTDSYRELTISHNLQNRKIGVVESDKVRIGDIKDRVIDDDRFTWEWRLTRSVAGDPLVDTGRHDV